MDFLSSKPSISSKNPDIQLNNISIIDSNAINEENIEPHIEIRDDKTNDKQISNNNNLTVTSINRLQNIFNFQNENNLFENPSDLLLQYVRDNKVKEVKDLLAHSLRASESEGNMAGQAKYDPEKSINSKTVINEVFNTREKAKLDLDIHDEVKQTPLIIACRLNFHEIATVLIEHGAKTSKNDMDGWTALLNASKNGNAALVKVLLAHKAPIEDRDCGGFTPLMWACYKNHLETVKVLLKHGANPNVQCKNSICCLSWASGRGYYDVVIELLNCPNIKINLQDQNSSTPLLWAARKGSLEIVKALIDHGANPDTPGMSNMSSLIMSCKHGHINVALYLSKLNNVNINHIDKDGHSALSIAAKSGFTTVVLSLLERGAYINTPNKKGDSILITAVKGGHKEIVEELLRRHVEIDAIGNQGKTAMHHAIEKGNLDLLRALLVHKPDLETMTKEGDTLLLLATKRKMPNIVNELLSSGSKVSPTDKNGDNVLHISLRNRSREITELILSNPKNSKYLYRPNRQGETPYKIDANNPKSILTQIFGARQLNMTEDSILGYDLYSSALAEILSEPSLHTPITVGLYAKWGSGKSFLLSQLKSEMKSFARLTRVVNLKLNITSILAIIVINLLFAVPLAIWQWSFGIILFVSLNALTFFLIGFFKFFYDKKQKDWAERVCDKISTQLSRLKLLLRILFLNPNKLINQDMEHKNLRYIFTEYGKISTIGGENALALMISALYTKMEDELGVVVTRLCPVFYNRSHSHSKFKRICCIPTFILVIAVLLVLLGLLVFIRIRGVNMENSNDVAFMVTFLIIILVSVVGSIYTWLRILWNVMRAPGTRIINAVNSVKDKNRMQESKVESLIFKLKKEVDLIAHTVKTIDAFTHSCTRLVIVIDGLDSCEQTKVIQILEIVHVLFTREGDPFICILAVDPHVLIKGIEGNLTAIFRNGNVNGHDYLRTIIHLPVYLQVDLSKAKALSKTPNQNYIRTHGSIIGSSQEMITKVQEQNKKKNKHRVKNMTKPMSPYDLTDQLIKSDYFLDVNPRNLRRLINIIALTGRLLRAYHIDFNWRVLASWIYLNEQWPYRCSWIVYYYEEHESDFNEETTLNAIYDLVKHKIPVVNEPLLELDRNARKFEQFIQSCEPPLTAMILKKILPCTCNLDPYLIKLIKDSLEANQEKFTHFPAINSISNLSTINNHNFDNQENSMLITPNSGNYPNSNGSNFNYLSINPFFDNPFMHHSNSFNDRFLNQINKPAARPAEIDSKLQPVETKKPVYINYPAIESHPSQDSFTRIEFSKPLDKMSANDITDYLCNQIEFIGDKYKEIYESNIKEKNINGKVLAVCNLNELKSEIQMTFGDWELFKNWVLSQRLLLSSQSHIKKTEDKQIRKVDAVDNANRLIKIDESKINKTQENANLDRAEQIKKSEENKAPKEALVLPIPPTLVKPTRKVEFVVTPVNEPSMNISKAPTEALKKNGINDLKGSPTTLPKRDTFASLSSSNGSDYNLDSSAQLLTFDNDKSTSPSHSNDHASLSLVSKIGKKIFKKSIENLFNKQASTSPPPVMLNKVDSQATNMSEVDYEPNQKYDYNDENNDSDSCQFNNEMNENEENIKKEYSKLETPKSGSTNTKSSIKKKSGNKGEKKSNNENKSSINNNKDSATTTYFIFDDEEYLNE